jgi:sugar (pentulose or hexulose) kinase
VVADLAQRPLTVSDTDEPVAVGACVQAAAVLLGSSPQAIAASWGLGSGRVVTPRIDPDAASSVRAAYAAARDSYSSW